MYRHNVKVRRQRNFMILLLAVIIMSISSVAGWIFIHSDVSGSSKSTDASPIVTDVEDKEKPKTKFEESQFKLELPVDWVLEDKDTRPFTFWKWKSTKKNLDDKSLTLYMDGSPPNQPINHLLPVSKNGLGLSVGSISDRCNEFTPDAQTALGRNETRPSRWQGISFICDIPNFNNQAVGTGSTDGLNKIVLQGPKSGKHDYFFLYVDHNIHPDNTIFTDAMRSFQVK